MLNNHNNKVMLIQTPIDQSYNKVITTIESCKTKEQLEGASNMVKNFKILYNLVGYPKALSYSLDRALKRKKL